MSWIEEQRERLAEQRTLGDHLKEASSWVFVLACCGFALYGGYRFFVSQGDGLATVAAAASQVQVGARDALRRWGWN